MNAKFLKTARPFTAVALAAGLAFGVAGCKSNTNSQAPIMNASLGPDPAAANLAPTDANGQPTQVMGASQSYTPQQQSESYPSGQQAPAPIVRGGAPDNSQLPVADYGTPQPDTYEQGYDNGVAQGEAIAQTDQAPPPLPEYDQPPAPDDNDIWTPGYWGYANTGYYWVPGVWVSAPYYGALWTPGYWGSYGGRYRWNHGYWGRHIGFYGGINYGWGYVGTGYYGGYWNGNRFYYNRECSHVSPRVTTVYERPVIVNNVRYTNVSNNRVSYNGGRGGIDMRPRPYEIAAAREQHVAPLPEQRQFHQQAATNRANAFAENHGRPAQAVFAQPITTHHMEAPVQRGGFGARPGEPVNGTPATAAAQRNLQMEQHNQQLQQHNNLAEQQRNAQLQQQQHNTQLEQQRNQQQHNVQAEQQRNLQTQQQHNVQAEQQQRNQQPQQQHNNVFDQHRVDETAQRNALQQQHQQQQVEQQRNIQMQQQRQTEMQQRSLQQEQQRNVQVQQQQHIQQQQPQHVEQPRIQPQPQHIEQPRVEQPRVEQQPQHIEQPRAQPQPQHIEQPHVEQQHAAPPPHVEAPRPAPAPQQGGGGHPGGGGGHPDGHGH